MRHKAVPFGPTIPVNSYLSRKDDKVPRARGINKRSFINMLAAVVVGIQSFLVQTRRLVDGEILGSSYRWASVWLAIAQES